MASHSLGLSLHEAARGMGVPFIDENEPLDRFVDANASVSTTWNGATRRIRRC